MATEMVKCTSGKLIQEVEEDGKKVQKAIPVDPALEVTVPFDFGGTLEEAIALHTKDQVFALYKAKGVIAVQDAGRRLLAQGKTPEQVIEAMKSFKFGITLKAPVDPKAAALAALGTMSPEERKAFLAELAKVAKERGLA